MLNFVTSQKGKPQLLESGFLFRLTKEIQHRRYWSCSVPNCKVSAVTEGDHFSKQPVHDNHIHPANAEGLNVTKFKNACKRKAVDTPTTSSTGIYNAVAEEWGPENDQVLPTNDQMQRLINRVKCKRLPASAATLANLVVESAWSTFADGRDFLLVNDGQDDRIIIFGTRENLTRLCSAYYIFMDGTFQAAPG